MEKGLIFVFLAATILAVNAGNNPDPPTFSSAYYVKGYIYLHYAEIVEYFDAYYDAENERSRIDYYDGLTKTYQLGNVTEYGQNIRIAFMTTEEVTNARTCFLVNGTDDDPILAQSLLPELIGFEYIGEKHCFDQHTDDSCHAWQKKRVDGDKISTYTMYTLLDGTPAAYVMHGYNSLIGSHYDSYIVVYEKYEPVQPDPSMFVVANVTCTSYPGSGVQHVNIHNPMKEFINHHEDHVHAHFENFKEKHGKEYADVKEHEMRKNVFRRNLRYIDSHNRAGKGFHLAVNSFADLTDQELKMMTGRLHSSGYNGGLPFDKEEHLKNDIPETVDWRLYGAVTPVKDQAICGSCWSFGTTGTIEGSLFLQTGQLVRLSEQALVDCSWGFGNNGCDGGLDYQSYQWIVKHGGIPTDESYGLYLGQDGYCHAENSTKVATILSYVNVTEGDTEALKAAIAFHGPISVSIDAAHKEFLFYSNGVYYNSDCKNGTDDLDHSVLAVGYGVLDGEPYWLIKNSWSTYWGNDGYVLMSQRDNNCGVVTAATYVNLQ